MGDKGKILLLVIAIFVISGVVCSASAGSFVDNTSHALDSMALVKSMDVMSSHIELESKLVDILTWQNIVIGVGAVLVLIIAFLVARGIGGGRNNNSGPVVIQMPSQGPAYDSLPGGMPHFVSFGPRGLAYIQSLNRDQKEYMLAEVENIRHELLHQLGRGNGSMAILPPTRALTKRHNSDTVSFR